MAHMKTDAARRLHQLVGASYVQQYSHNARFRATIEAALHGSTRDDVMALLVNGLAAACDDTESMRARLVEITERTPPPPIRYRTVTTAEGEA